jgi:hypothetical protein
VTPADRLARIRGIEDDPRRPWFDTDWARRPGFFYPEDGARFSTNDPQPESGRAPLSRNVASAEPSGGLSDQANLGELNKQRGEATA